MVFLLLKKATMKYALPFLLLPLFFACKNEPKAAAITTEETPLPAGFTEFYQRFHTDSIFQMAHIVFPLEGLPPQADTKALADKSFRWQAEDWQMMRPVDWQMSEYERIILPLGSTLVEEHIVHPESGIGMKRRFSVIGDEWHLIYYAGMNRIAKQ